MTVSVNDGGTWKSASPYVNDAGTWKLVKEVWVNDAGTWKLASGVTFSQAPGSYSVATGVNGGSFTVTASKAVTWTYTKSLSVTASQGSGVSSGGITFSVARLGSGTVSLSVVDNGITYSWDVSFSSNAN